MFLWYASIIVFVPPGCKQIRKLSLIIDLTLTFLFLTFSRLAVGLQKSAEITKGPLCIAKPGTDWLHDVGAIGRALAGSFIKNVPSLKRRSLMSILYPELLAPFQLTVTILAIVELHLTGIIESRTLICFTIPCTNSRLLVCALYIIAGCGIVIRATTTVTPGTANEQT